MCEIVSERVCVNQYESDRKRGKRNERKRVREKEGRRERHIKYSYKSYFIIIIINYISGNEKQKTARAYGMSRLNEN